MVAGIAVWQQEYIHMAIINGCMAARLAAGQQEQSHDGRNSRTAARIATWWQGEAGW